MPKNLMHLAHVSIPINDSIIKEPLTNGLRASCTHRLILSVIAAADMAQLVVFPPL